MVLTRQIRRPFRVVNFWASKIRQPRICENRNFCVGCEPRPVCRCRLRKKTALRLHSWPDRRWREPTASYNNIPTIPRLRIVTTWLSEFYENKKKNETFSEAFFVGTTATVVARISLRYSVHAWLPRSRYIPEEVYPGVWV